MNQESLNDCFSATGKASRVRAAAKKQKHADQVLEDSAWFLERCGGICQKAWQVTGLWAPPMSLEANPFTCTVVQWHVFLVQKVICNVYCFFCRTETVVCMLFWSGRISFLNFWQYQFFILASVSGTCFFFHFLEVFDLSGQVISLLQGWHRQTHGFKPQRKFRISGLHKVHVFGPRGWNRKEGY